MPFFTVKELYKNYADNLALHWLVGEEHGERQISLKNDQKLANIGYLNFIHPHQVQIIGFYELDYLESLDSETYQRSLNQLFANNNLACIIIVDDITVPEDIHSCAQNYQIPLLSSKLPGENVINFLHASFAKLFAPRVTLHGVFMDVLGMGVLIMGESGTGKSELALELVSRGHRLVADDAPEFSHVSPKVLSGTCPLPGMGPFLEVRGLGVLNVQALFGDSAIKPDKFLRLIVHLKHMTAESMREIDRLQGSYGVRQVLSVDIPEIYLPVAAGRNLAVLLECAVRNHSLRMHGYNAADDFCAHQHRAMMMEQNQTEYYPHFTTH